MSPEFQFDPAPFAVVATAIHAGHGLRPSLARLCALDDSTRLREEDPHTDELLPFRCGRTVVHASRFEFDLNRPRETAVYREPDQAWGLDLWREPMPTAEVERSHLSYDEFYAELGRMLDTVAERGPFLVLDLHSYNHRRSGPDSSPDDPRDSPEINLGTRWLDRERWGFLVDGVAESLRESHVAGHRLDVRENLRFKGGQLTRWVNARYEGRGSAFAVEFKKVFMDEWTGDVDRHHVHELARATERAADRAAELLETAP
jgi:N-formylglutamate deformylase